MWFAALVLPIGVTLLLTVVLTAGYCALVYRYVLHSREETDSSHRESSTFLDRQLRNTRRISILDPDTALLQRWYFELRVAEEAARCQRYGLKMVLALVRAEGEGGKFPAGVDPFPILARTLRTADLATRLSSTEYAFCLPHTTEEGARSAVQRLIGKKQVGTVSVGFAVCPRDGEDLDSLLDQARSTATTKVIEASPKRQERYLQIVESLQRDAFGELSIGKDETAKGLKVSLRHAARRVGVSLRIWEVDGRLYFEKVTAAPEPSTAAESSAA
jgi:GGDEF domain-containing protein